MTTTIISPTTMYDKQERQKGATRTIATGFRNNGYNSVAMLGQRIPLHPIPRVPSGLPNSPFLVLLILWNEVLLWFGMCYTNGLSVGCRAVTSHLFIDDLMKPAL